MADILNQNGLSSGAFTTPTGGAATPPTGASGGRPGDVIPTAAKNLTSIGALQYPSDLPKYYMGFQVCRYARESLMEIGKTDLLNTMFLPFPDQMIDVNQVAFEQVAFSATIGNIADVAFKNVQQVKQAITAAGPDGGQKLYEAGKAFGKTLWDNREQLGTAAGIDATKALAGEQGMNLAKAVTGYSPNYFLTVVLDGPRYKQYTTSWTMAPRNAKEAADLTQIIRVFKDALSPGLAASGALFTFPRIFKNYYAPNRGHLYQFKPSVLINFTVNYSAGGMPSMKQAKPETNGWNAPSAIRISATFLELEFWLRGDFGDVTPGANPNQASADAIEPVAGNRFAT